MYEWHAKHPVQGRRFGEAMESVSKSEGEPSRPKYRAFADSNVKVWTLEMA
jgi:hypothetical protein